CHAAPSETAQAAIAAITKAVNECGAPALILSDNGVAFAGQITKPSRVVRTDFARTANQWGTRVIHSSPYHPQTSVKAERHHQSLKKWLATQDRIPATLAQLQRLLNRYRDYYNQRRHSALRARATPQQAWDNATSYGGPTHLPIQTDASVHRSKVSSAGHI